MRFLVSLVFIFSVSSHLFSQNKLTLEEIWSGKFSPNYLEEIHHLNNGKEYSVFNADNRETKIVSHDYLDNSKSEIIVSAKDLAIPYFENYEFSDDETSILLGTEIQSRYRYSTSGIYYVYHRDSKKLQKIASTKIFSPKFSPDGSYITYIFENNLFNYHIPTEKTTQLTNDGVYNKIINGLADWVYEEEFEIVTAFSWNNDNSKLAFFKFDESQVPQYSMDVYGSGSYPDKEQFKYPKAGENNSKVTAHVIDIASSKIETIDLSSFESYYLPRLQWSNNPNKLVIQSMNRHQNTLSFLSYDTSSKKTTSIYSEENNTYIDITNNLTFLKDNSFLTTSEKSGFTHLYHFSASGKLKKQITIGNWDITDFYGIDSKEEFLYYQSTEGNSTERHVFKIKLNGKSKTQLSTTKGIHDANFNADLSKYIDTFSNIETPYEFTLYNTKDGKKLKALKDNSALKNLITPYNLPKKEITTVKINGYDLNTWMIKPIDFDASKKYPVLLFQYSGPGSQMVKNSWQSYNDQWHKLLAQKGYIVACVDGRGTGFKGSEFKKITQLQLGKLEAEDQIAFAKHLAKKPFINATRIGIWGWSFGGFTSLNAILKDNSVFKAAISVAPVTHWKYYDTVYTERFLTTPQENAKGYDENSPLSYAENLNCKLLLVHGSADDNVHVQNTLQMASEFIKANKKFDLEIYPDKNHGIYGGNTRLHLFTKMTDFILENL